MNDIDVERAKKTCGYCLTEFDCKKCARLCAEKCYIKLGFIDTYGEEEYNKILYKIGLFKKHSFNLGGK